MIFLIYKILTRRQTKKMEEVQKQAGTPYFRIINIRKDPNLLLNLFALFMFFIMFLIFIFLALLLIVIKDVVSIKLNLFFIGIIFVFIIVSIVYIVRSKIFR